MKRKLSTKLFSAFLAVIMVLTSVPFVALASFNDDDKAAVVKQATDEMDKFETMLESGATSYANVTPAYNAYVALQKALDAYQYGSTASSAVTSAVSALSSAMSGMVEYNSANVKGTAIPTFANSDTYAMAEWEGRGFYNVLYAPQATVQTSAVANNSNGEASGVSHESIYASNAVLLYNNGAPMVIPVMAGIVRTIDAAGYNARNKDRKLRTMYPYADDSFNDDANWGFDGLWYSGNGNDMNWNWNYWSGQSNNSGSSMAYNNATGFKGKNQSVYMTATVPTGGINRGGFINWTYSDGGVKHLYASNALKFKGTAVADYNQEYTLKWYSTSGASEDGDVAYATASTPIRVINYSTLADAISKKAKEIKGSPVDDYSEGGLVKYFEVMDKARAWDPNTYFSNNTDGYSACVTDMKSLVQTDIAGVNVSSLAKDSDGYKALREAMDNRAADYNKGVNTIYQNFDGFTNLYSQAIALMNEVYTNTSGYSRGTEAQTLANQINAYVLEKNEDVKKVVADELVALIDAYNKYDKTLFVTTDNAQAVIDNAIAIVWQNGTYKKEADLLDDKDDNQAVVDAQVALVKTAIEGLRINSDAIAMTSEGYYSLNQAVALIADLNNIKGHPYSDYSDFSTLQSLVNSVTADGGYRYQLANTPLTDYDAQVETYKKTIADIVYAYEHIHLSFMVMEDGTIAKSANQLSSSVEGKVTSNINREAYLGFSATGAGGLILRKNHNAATVKYGEATISFGTTVNGDKYNNFLDSFSLNADNQSTSIEFASSGNDTLPTLNDTQKSQYPGLLSVDGITLSNLRVTGMSDYYNSGYFAYSESGTDVRINDVNSNEYDSILATSTGKHRQGGIFAKSTASDHFGTIHLTGDLSVTAPATTAIADKNVYLSKDELLAKYPEAYVISNPSSMSTEHYYGGLIAWNANGSSAAFQYSGFSYFKSNETYTTGVTILDLSNYFDFVALCDLLASKDSDRYTAESWEKFASALNAAKTYEYEGKEASTIRSNLNDKYLILYNAVDGLTEKTFTVNFITKDANGADVTTSILLGYQDTVANHSAEFNAIDLDATYVEGNMTYSFSHFTPEFNENLIVSSDATYTAVYVGTVNYVNFDEYNQTKAALLDLADYTYTTDDLGNIAVEISNYTYFDMPEAERETILATDENVAAVNAETAAMQALIDSLTPADVSEDYKDVAYAAQKVFELADADKKDVDRYDLVPDFTVFEDVAITDTVSVVGWNFVDDASINNAIADFLNELTIKTYDIFLNGDVLAQDIPFGTAVIVDSDATYSTNVADTDENDTSLGSVNWSYSFNAPSRNSDVPTPSKYYLTAPSFGFNVQGDTWLTTTAATSTDSTYVVKVVATTGNILDVTVTSGSYDLSVLDVPNYAFYNFKNFTLDGEVVSGNINVTKNTTIVANYEAEAKDAYTISYATSFDEACESIFTTNTYAYNTRVTLTASEDIDVYCWAIAKFNDYNGDLAELVLVPVSYDTTGEYSFYTCESFEMIDEEMLTGMALVPLTVDEYNTFASAGSAAQAMSGKFYTNNGVYGAPDIEIYEDPDATEYLEDINGNRIMPTQFKYRSNRFTAVEDSVVEAPAVSVNKNQYPIKNGSAVEKFTLVGTFIVPEGYTMIESGFVFATNDTISEGLMTLDNVGDGVLYRYKSPKYTVGNQFFVNIVNPSFNVSYKYVAYSIISDAEGNLITCYSNSVSGNNNF